MATPSRLCQNLFNPTVISHLELLCPVFELVQYLHPPKVVEEGSKRKMDACLFVEVISEIPIRGKFSSPSFGLLYNEDTSMNKEGGEHPCKDNRSPTRMVRKQGQESEKVRCNIYCW